jgi:simple sugar transport system substrate-binding protein
VAGCGAETEIREPDLLVAGDAAAATAPPARREPARRTDAVRLAVVTHGQASSSFWVVVRIGIDAAARQVDASVSYRSPDTYSVERMSALIDAAVAAARRPRGDDPQRGLAPAIRRAVAAGIPVVSINSGSDRFRELGVLAHIGQPRAGGGGGRGAPGARRACAGACASTTRRATPGWALRCRAFARAMRRAGGRRSSCRSTSRTASAPASAWPP